MIFSHSFEFFLCVVVQLLRCIRLFGDPMDCSPPAPLSIVFPGQEYWSGLPFPSPGDLPDPGIKPASLMLPGGFLLTDPAFFVCHVIIAHVQKGIIGRLVQVIKGGVTLATTVSHLLFSLDCKLREGGLSWSRCVAQHMACSIYSLNVV